MIERSFSGPSAELINKLSMFATATVYEAIGRIGALHSSIKPLNKSLKLCGPAFTVQGSPADNLALHQAIYLAQPGDIIIASVDGYDEAGYWGDIMTNAAKTKKLGGLVFDGAVRDSQELMESGFPIFCKNVCIKGTAKSNAGIFNIPLNLMGVTIYPSDIVIGDADGIVVIPNSKLEEAVTLSQNRVDKEKDILRELGSKTTLEIYNLK